MVAAGSEATCSALEVVPCGTGIQSWEHEYLFVKADRGRLQGGKLNAETEDELPPSCRGASRRWPRFVVYPATRTADDRLIGGYYKASGRMRRVCSRR